MSSADRLRWYLLGSWVVLFQFKSNPKDEGPESPFDATQLQLNHYHLFSKQDGDNEVVKMRSKNVLAERRQAWSINILDEQ